MKARVGDEIVIKGHTVGEHDRDGEVLEVKGVDGGPPYRVRWSDTGHETIFFPGSDATVHHLGAELMESGLARISKDLAGTNIRI